MSAKYRVAIIGTGRMGGLIEDEVPVGSFSKPYGHFGGYAAVPETEVVAVANRGQERLDRFVARFGGAGGAAFRPYLDYREMIEKERPDIVSVTTPSLARAEPIIFAAEHGVRAIYAEKGLCASLEEADRVAAAVRANRVAFNWGAMRRHHDGFRQLAAAIAGGAIGQPRYAVMSFFTDLIKHHPHTLDLVSMLLGDPRPAWVEGRLVDAGDPLAAAIKRPLPTFDAAANRYVPAAGAEIGDPMVGYFRVGYDGGAEGIFLPRPGSFDVDVVGSEGRAVGWDNGQYVAVRRGGHGSTVQETQFRPTGASPTVCTIRDLVRELETGERTSGNIDVTMQSVETQFALVHSHLADGARVSVPVADRTLYVPGG
jgi:predicted dehydrogenase